MCNDSWIQKWHFHKVKNNNTYFNQYCFITNDKCWIIYLSSHTSICKTTLVFRFFSTRKKRAIADGYRLFTNCHWSHWKGVTYPLLLNARRQKVHPLPKVISWICRWVQHPDTRVLLAQPFFKLTVTFFILLCGTC